MKARKTGKNGAIATVEVDVSADQVAEQSDECFRMLASRSGLQATDAPSAKKAFDERFGAVLAQKMFEDAFMEMIAPRALVLAGVRAIGSPAFFPDGHISRTRDFSFKMEVAERPQVELDSYEPVEISLVPFSMPEGFVHEQLEQLLALRPEYETDDSHDDVRKGDTIEIDLKVSSEGKVIDGISADGRYYQTGRGAMPEDFERQVIGMKAGTKASFDFEVPSAPRIKSGTYQAEIAVKRICKVVVPELTDEWVRENFKSCKNIGDLEKIITEEATKSAQASYGMYKNKVVATAIAGRISEKIPPEITRQARLDYERRFNVEAQQHGMSHEQYLASQGITDEQFASAAIVSSLEELKEELAMDAVSRHFKLTADNADVDAYLELMAPGKAAETRQGFMHAGRMQELRDAALRMKGCTYMADRAIVTYVDPADANAAAADAADKPATK